MSVPTLLLIGSDAALVEALQLQVADVFAADVIAELSRVAAHVRSQPPSVVIADFRIVSGGGHAEEVLLEEIAGLPRRPLVIVLAGSDCPEPIERHMACTGAVLLRGPLDIDEIVSHLPGFGAEPKDDRGDAPDDVSGTSELEASEPRVIAEEGPEFALSGLTRRFETKTAKLRNMLTDLEVAARHDVTVLLIGETGAGKTFLARLIHVISPRRNEPFLPIACGALRSDLIESEMFGHVKGSFTSAHADK